MYNVYEIWGCLREGETVILFPVQMSAQPLGLTPNPEATIGQLKVCSMLDCLGLSFLSHLDACHSDALHLCFLICKTGMLMPPRGVVVRTKCMWSMLVSVH